MKDRVSKARRKLGISQAELSRRVGVKQQSIQQLEDGIVKRPRYLLELAEALQVNPKWLTEGIEPQSPAPEANLTPLQPIEAWDSNSPLDPDEVEVPLFREVQLAAGNGHAHQIEYNGAKLKFAKSSLRRAGVPEESAACAFVSGDSMEPMLPDGSTVGVDTSATNIVDGKLYAIDHNGELRVKQVFRIPGGRGLRFHSFNPDKANFGDEELSPEQLQEQNVRIIGRVFWSAAFW